MDTTHPPLPLSEIKLNLKMKMLKVWLKIMEAWKHPLLLPKNILARAIFYEIHASAV